MKDLTYKELMDAPTKIQYLYTCAIYGQYVGSAIHEEAMREHPEYFPEEIEHKKKWDAIPQEVHDAYWKEYWKLEKDIFKDVPPSKGIFGWLDDPDGEKIWSEKWNEANDKLMPLIKKLDKKYYSKYGI